MPETVHHFQCGRPRGPDPASGLGPHHRCLLRRRRCRRKRSVKLDPPASDTTVSIINFEFEVDAGSSISSLGDAEPAPHSIFSFAAVRAVAFSVACGNVRSERVFVVPEALPARWRRRGETGIYRMYRMIRHWEAGVVVFAACNVISVMTSPCFHDILTATGYCRRAGRQPTSFLENVHRAQVRRLVVVMSRSTRLDPALTNTVFAFVVPAARARASLQAPWAGEEGACREIENDWFEFGMSNVDLLIDKAFAVESGQQGQS